MLPLFDMMMRAQNGNAVEAMARQFNMAQDQVTKAMAALTPAFSSGFKRNATNPYDFPAIASAMMSGNYAKYFEDMSKAFTPQGVADGNTVLESLFGSKEVSRAIAQQAAQMTGVGQDVLKQMMPVMADTLMGGLFKQATGQMADVPNPFAGSPMGQMMQQWLESTGFVRKAKQPDTLNPFDNPFTKAFQDMMGGVRQQPQPAAANPFLDNPFAKAFQDMMAATLAQQKPEAQSAKAEAKAEEAPAASFAQMLNTMFDSGLDVQKSYQKSMEQIFDTYRKTAEAMQAEDDKGAEPPPPEKD